MNDELNTSAIGTQPTRVAHTASRGARLSVVTAGLWVLLALTGCGSPPNRPVTPTMADSTSTPVLSTPVTATVLTPAAGMTPSHTPAATPTRRQPTIVPTATATASATSSPTSTAVPTAAPTATHTSTPIPPGPITGLRDRICTGIARGTFADYPWGSTLPGWYLDWRVHAAPATIPGTDHAQMVRLSGDSFYPDLATVQLAAQASPGALWLIGNEPDVTWQDNVPPAVYATTYHTLYTAIKAADPTAQVAIGAVSQVTPLRLRYLEEVLAAYTAQFGTPMPVDVWNIHVFVLREETDSWGVGLPPGMENATDGTLWNLEDHARVELVAEQVRTFRRWMAAHDQRAKPLIISEYGILMPADYGFEPPVVSAFLSDTFDYFAQARDQTTGYPTDDNRLVQRWCWYSAGDTTFPTGNLFDTESKQPTFLWPVFAGYLR